jgi:hypothetical protein
MAKKPETTPSLTKRETTIKSMRKRNPIKRNSHLPMHGVAINWRDRLEKKKNYGGQPN